MMYWWTITTWSGIKFEFLISRRPRKRSASCEKAKEENSSDDIFDVVWSLRIRFASLVSARIKFTSDPQLATRSNLALAFLECESD